MQKPYTTIRSLCTVSLRNVLLCGSNQIKHLIFHVNGFHIEASIVNHIGDRAVMPWIPVGLKFERRLAKGLSDHPLNI